MPTLLKIKGDNRPPVEILLPGVLSVLLMLAFLRGSEKLPGLEKDESEEL